MITANGVLAKGLACALVLVMGCTSVTDVKLERLSEKEKGRMAGIPGLRVYGYAPKGGEEQEVDAYVRRVGTKGYHFQPVGGDSKVPAFIVKEGDLEDLLLIRVDPLKTIGGTLLVAVAIPFILLVGFAADGGIEGLLAVSTGGLATWK